MGIFFKGKNDKGEKNDKTENSDKTVNKDLYSTMDLISNDLDFDKDPNEEEEIDPVYLYDAIKPNNTAYYSAGIDRSGDPMSALAAGDAFRQKKLTDADYSSITSVHRESFLKSMQDGKEEKTSGGTSNIQSAFDNDALNAYYDRNLSGARDTYSEQEKRTNPIFGDLSAVQSNPQEYGNLSGSVRRSNITYGGSNNYGSAGYGGMDYGNSGMNSSNYGYGGNSYGNSSGFGQSGFGQSGFGQSGFGQSGFGQTGSSSEYGSQNYDSPNYGGSGFAQTGYGTSDHPLFENKTEAYGTNASADGNGDFVKFKSNIVQGYDQLFYAQQEQTKELQPEESAEYASDTAEDNSKASAEESYQTEAEETSKASEESYQSAAEDNSKASAEEIPETEVKETVTEQEKKADFSSYSENSYNKSYYSFLMEDDDDPFAYLRKKKEPAEEPKSDGPATEETVTEEAVAEETVTKENVTEEPVNEESVTEEPATEEFVTEEPAAEETATEDSATEEAVTEEPVTEEAAPEEFVKEEPVAEESETEEPVTEENATEDATEETATVDSAAEEAVTEETVTEEAETEESVTEEKVAEEKNDEKMNAEKAAQDEKQSKSETKNDTTGQTAWFMSMMDEFMNMMNKKESDGQNSSEENTKNGRDTESSKSYSGTYNDGYEDVCFVCRRPESKAGKMFHMPNNISVCADCMRRTMETVSQFDYQGMLGPEMSQEDLEKELNNLNGNSGMPHFSFINLANLTGDGGIPNKQKIKRKKKDEAGKEEPIFDIKKIPPPHKIREKLDEYVVGQDRAKKIMSVAVYNHYKRVACDTNDDIEIEKSNMLMIGPTGSGKTYLVKTLAKLLDVPLAIADATSLTEAGYIGDDIESVVSKLLAAADNDVERAEKGIIFIDEIDKIAKKVNANARDVSGESVQQGMLKLLEGAEVEVPVGASSKGAMVPLATVDTKNILFICGGAFPDLEDIIKERLMKSSSIGFGATLKDTFDKDKDILSKVKTEDIRKFGMIPEFLGRLPIVFTLESVTKDMLMRILNEPKNAILKQYQKLLALDEVKLQFSDDAIEAIAEKAMEQDTGARALRSIIEDFMLDIMYEIPKDDNIGTVTITGDYIRGTGGPVIGMRGSEMPEIEEKKSDITGSDSTTDTDNLTDIDEAAKSDN